MEEVWLAVQPHLSLWLGLAWVAYLVGLSIWIVLQQREPVATLSWIMSLAMIPVLGLLVYHFFGPQRIRRQRLKRLRARARVAELRPGAALHPDSHPLMRLAQASSGYPPSTSSTVRLLPDGISTFDALVEAIGKAEHHIHAEYYIFDADQTGTRVRDALAERARAGVRVRLLLDAIGSSGATRRFLAPLVQAGAEVEFFHRFRLHRLLRPRLNLRSHRKIVVVDGAIGFTGGINISDTENAAVRKDAFHDLHLRMDGPSVRWLQLAFLEDWSYASGRAPADAEQWPEQAAGTIRTQVLPAGPDSQWETIHRVMVEALHAACSRAWLVTPYFVPGEAARMALTSAALRGLDVRLLVPRQSDSRIVSAAARSYFDELLTAGVRIFEYPSMLHTKALLLDDDTCILGSSNFDHRSFRLNFELCVLFEDAAVAANLARLLEMDLALATEVKGPRQPGRAAHLGEAVARLLSPLL